MREMSDAEARRLAKELLELRRVSHHDSSPAVIIEFFDSEGTKAVAKRKGPSSPSENALSKYTHSPAPEQQSLFSIQEDIEKRDPCASLARAFGWGPSSPSFHQRERALPFVGVLVLVIGIKCFLHSSNQFLEPNSGQRGRFFPERRKARPSQARARRGHSTERPGFPGKIQEPATEQRPFRSRSHR